MSANDVTSENQIPAWMKQAQRGVDWGSLIIVGFCLIASWSFITQSQIPAYNDTEHYVYQIADYAEAFSEGITYTRWSPYAIYGYGAPIPHYYPSGTAYIGGLITYLFTNDALVSTRILYTLSIILAGSMTYHFVKQRTSALSGMIASLIYIFSPFMMFIVPHIEGDLAFSLGLGLLPSFLWAVSRFLKRNQAFDFALLALIVAIIIFTIPSILIQGLIASMVLIAIDFRQGINIKMLLSIIGAILTGFLLSSFFWLPALTQYNEIQWYPALIETPRYKIIFENLFIASQPIDSGLMIPRPVYNFGWGLLFILPISLITLIIKRQNRLFYISYLGLGIVTLLSLILFFPQQTSWFALIILCLAIAGSYHGYHSSSPRILQRLSIWFSMLVIIISSIPSWIIPSSNLIVEGVSGTDQIQYQQSGYGYSGLPSGWALPSHLPPTNIVEIPIGEIVNRDSRITANLGIEATLLSESSYTGVYNINTTDSLDIEYRRAYFSNWQASSSVGNFPITKSNNNFISLNIPPNTDTIMTLGIGLTFITGLAWLVALLGLIICGVMWWYRWRLAEISYDTSILIERKSTKILLFMFISFTIIRFLAPTIPSSLFTRPEQYSMSSSLIVRTNFDSDFQLFAHDELETSYSQGSTVQFRAYWMISTEVKSHYLVQLRLTDASRQDTYYESGYVHAGYYPSNRWEIMQPLPQDFIFRVPSTLNEYFITIDVYECNTACSSDIMETRDAQGQIPILRPIIVD